MNTKPIERQFLRMGVRIKVQAPAPPRQRWIREQSEYSLDVQRDRRGEHFVLTVPRAQEETLEANVLQVRPDEKHLLLMVRREEGGDIDRFLCGHDEREWFVAAVPGAVSTVDAAMESLKPALVRGAQARARLNGKERKRRKNKAFRRQGEWFFLPRPGLDLAGSLVLGWEPIARSGGKPHMVQFLVRTGGQLLYLCPNRPQGLSEPAYRRLIARNPKAKGWGWQARRINPQVFAKGEVRHPDHKTIVLDDWHEVLMNTEHQSRTMENVAFID
jgi:hypothetical protein